MLIELQMRLR